MFLRDKHLKGPIQLAVNAANLGPLPDVVVNPVQLLELVDTVLNQGHLQKVQVKRLHRK